MHVYTADPQSDSEKEFLSLSSLHSQGSWGLQSLSDSSEATELASAGPRAPISAPALS